MDLNSYYKVAATGRNGFDWSNLPVIPSNGNITHLGVIGRDVKHLASRFYLRVENYLHRKHRYSQVMIYDLKLRANKRKF